jgi:hypothetical protein
VNKSFTASGRLKVTLTRGWEQHPVLSQRDSSRSTLEDQLPALIRVLEIGEAEAEWARKEEERRPEIREDRWKEVKKEAFVHMAYERNAKRLLAELDSRDATAAMRAYADEIDARASALEAPSRAGGTRVGRVDPRARRAHGPTKRGCCALRGPVVRGEFCGRAPRLISCRPRLVPVRPVGGPATHVRLEFFVTARGDLL